MFKIGNAFFDFTPFKLAQNVWPAYWLNQTHLIPDILDPTTSADYSYQYEVGFCQLMSEANNATCKNDAYAIGSYLNATLFE